MIVCLELGLKFLVECSLLFEYRFCVERNCGREWFWNGLFDGLGQAVVDFLERGHAVDVLAAVGVGLGDFVQDGGHFLAALVQDVDEAVGVARVLGDEYGDVLFDVGHAHAIQVQTQIDREVCVYDVVQIGQF